MQLIRNSADRSSYYQSQNPSRYPDSRQPSDPQSIDVCLELVNILNLESPGLLEGLDSFQPARLRMVVNRTR